jgi:hypothetical protein
MYAGGIYAEASFPQDFPQETTRAGKLWVE